MAKELIITKDGSHSLLNTNMGVSYHSKHGAIQESQHIFIDEGLKPLLNKHAELSIFEMGFGTGLNTLLTYITTENYPVKIYYETIETDPVAIELASSFNYTTSLNRPDLQSKFMQLHQLPWDSPQPLSDNFYFYKRRASITDILLTSTFNLVYFDAFDPVTQPALWTTTIFAKLYSTMAKDGVLVTYCSKGIVRRAMQEAGFSIEKVPGPPGKREIVRATKHSV
jgi:tRNA U34 5-methylaminomethyl-2-thiouridine-forming methyltransferase MnmC